MNLPGKDYTAEQYCSKCLHIWPWKPALTKAQEEAQWDKEDKEHGEYGEDLE